MFSVLTFILGVFSNTLPIGSEILLDNSHLPSFTKYSGYPAPFRIIVPRGLICTKSDEQRIKILQPVILKPKGIFFITSCGSIPMIYLHRGHTVQIRGIKYTLDSGIFVNMGKDESMTGMISHSGIFIRGLNFVTHSNLPKTIKTTAGDIQVTTDTKIVTNPEGLRVPDAVDFKIKSSILSVRMITEIFDVEYDEITKPVNPTIPIVTPAVQRIRKRDRLAKYMSCSMPNLAQGFP